MPCTRPAEGQDPGHAELAHITEAELPNQSSKMRRCSVLTAVLWRPGGQGCLLHTAQPRSLPERQPCLPRGGCTESFCQFSPRGFKDAKALH